VPLAVVEAAMALAKQHGARVLLNAAPAQPLPEDLLARVDVLLVNRSEAVLLADAAAPAAPETCAWLLRERGPELVAVTLGAEGALAVDAQGLHRQPGFKTDAIDAVGAGDAFAGAMAVALGEGHPVGAVLRFACAAGALATTRRGAVPSLPARAEVEAFLARQG
jgi:ribokinase